MAVLKAAAQSEQIEIRRMARDMFAGCVGYDGRLIPGALAVCVASVLMKYGEGAADVDDFASHVRDIINDTEALKGSGEKT